MPKDRKRVIKKVKEGIERRRKDNQPLKRASPVQRANPNRKKGLLRLAKTKTKKTNS